MPRSKTTIKPLSRPRKRTLAESSGAPRWVVAVGVLPIAFALWLAVLSDGSGNLRKPGLGSLLFLAAVTGVASFLIYTAQTGHSAEKKPRADANLLSRISPASRGSPPDTAAGSGQRVFRR
jgi:hypothetical protein